ncbi:MAG: response regulator [Candidatus Sulfotelmatobacter sp.]
MRLQSREEPSPIEPMAAGTIRVSIIDDDRALTDGLSQIIGQAENFVCSSSFSSVEQAIPVLRKQPPDVLLLDIELPGMDGDEAVRVFRNLCPHTHILMLTIFADRKRIFESICNGASGYLLKSTPSRTLLEGIRSTASGGCPLSPEIARQIVDLFQHKTARFKISESAALGTQEIRLLTLLAEGYSYVSAAEKMNISVNTVRNYVRSVYEKLHVHSKSGAVSKAIREGLIR